MEHNRIFALAALLSLAASSTHAALITFSGLDGHPQGSPISSTYQPLLNTYSGTSSGGNSGTPQPYSDGANIGVTVTFDGGSSTSQRGQNGGVTDHTNDGSGTVWYDNGNNSMSLSFSQAVTVPSFYYANYNAGSFNIQFQGYNGASLVFDTGTFSYSQPTGYSWIQETGLGTTPITSLVITGPGFKQIDDMTILLATPEPASMLLLGLGAAGLLIAVRRRRA
jgi:hypothetical protein